MKKILLLLLLCMAGTVFSQEILLKNGKKIKMDSILSKNQYGIMVRSGKTDPDGNQQMRRFISFFDMNPASLSLFPFCDVKAVDRIHTSVLDRVDLIKKKFSEELKSFEGVTDSTKNLKIHAGVHRYRVLFNSIEPAEYGQIGWLFSDSADSQFYGRIYLYGLLGSADQIWIGDIYPTDRTYTKNGNIYPVFTVIEPEKRQPGEAPQNVRDKERRDGKRQKPAKRPE